MKFFHLSITGLILRFYLLMAVVLVAGFTGTWAVALLALPIFMSCMLGITGEPKPAAALPHAEEVAEATPESEAVIVGLEPYPRAAAHPLAAA